MSEKVKLINIIQILNYYLTINWVKKQMLRYCIQFLPILKSF
ncbi:hypothetical protein [Nitrosarchaeum sp. AC2]